MLVGNVISSIVCGSVCRLKPPQVLADCNFKKLESPLRGEHILQIMFPMLYITTLRLHLYDQADVLRCVTDDMRYSQFLLHDKADALRHVADDMCQTKQPGMVHQSERCFRKR